MRKQTPRICGIYAIIHKPSGKTYIGQSKDIEARFTEHVTYAQKDNSSEARTPLNRALRKHPLEEFSFEILKSVDEEDADKLDWWERYYIRKYNTVTPNGYNVEAGGHRGTEVAKLYRLDNKPIAGIYLLTCLTTGKRYVGQSKNILKRIESHWSRMNNDKDNGYNTPLHKEMRKHPKNEWTFHLLEVVNDDELDLLDEFEQEFIEKYDTSFPNGYNVMGGGQKNKKAPLNEEAMAIALPRNVSRHSSQALCKTCGKPICSGASYCIDCYKEKCKENIPDKNELYDILLEKCSFSEVSKNYGVSSNAVAKWAKMYEIPSHIRYYKAARKYGINSKEAYQAWEEDDKKSHVYTEQEIIDTYAELENLTETARKLHVDQNRIVNILCSNGYSRETIRHNRNKKKRKAVKATFCREGKQIEFESLSAATRFLKEHGYTQIRSDYHIRTHIKECVEGTRKTFAGFRWEYL